MPILIGVEHNDSPPLTPTDRSVYTPNVVKHVVTPTSPPQYHLDPRGLRMLWVGSMWVEVTYEEWSNAQNM